ncbi:MAG: DUF6338 family protein [Candidatus Azobacteroides sp.]|nr:DUF6338 family protein [Candidatus Azobacteroides sp.]
MENITIDKILLLIMFFVPGFVYLKAYRLFIAETKTDFSKDLYEAIGISLINAVIFLPILNSLCAKNVVANCTFLYISIIFVVIVVVPFCEAWMLYKLSRTKWFSKSLLTLNNSAWDDFFAKRKDYWVIATLKSGRKIAGKYASKSYASAYPAPKEIYLEEVLELKKDNTFGEKVNRTHGILIAENEISTIEFYR